MTGEEFGRLLSRFEDASVALHVEGTPSAQERWHAAGDAVRGEVQALRDAVVRLEQYARDEHAQGWREAVGYVFGMAAGSTAAVETATLWRAAEKLDKYAKELRETVE